MTRKNFFPILTILTMILIMPLAHAQKNPRKLSSSPTPPKRVKRSRTSLIQNKALISKVVEQKRELRTKQSTENIMETPPERCLTYKELQLLQYVGDEQKLWRHYESKSHIAQVYLPHLTPIGWQTTSYMNRNGSNDIRHDYPFVRQRLVPKYRQCNAENANFYVPYTQREDEFVGLVELTEAEMAVFEAAYEVHFFLLNQENPDHVRRQQLEQQLQIARSAFLARAYPDSQMIRIAFDKHAQPIKVDSLSRAINQQCKESLGQDIAHRFIQELSEHQEDSLSIEQAITETANHILAYYQPFLAQLSEGDRRLWQTYIESAAVGLRAWRVYTYLQMRKALSTKEDSDDVILKRLDAHLVAWGMKKESRTYLQKLYTSLMQTKYQRAYDSTEQIIQQTTRLALEQLNPETKSAKKQIVNEISQLVYDLEWENLAYDSLKSRIEALSFYPTDRVFYYQWERPLLALYHSVGEPELDTLLNLMAQSSLSQWDVSYLGIQFKPLLDSIFVPFESNPNWTSNRVKMMSYASIDTLLSHESQNMEIWTLFNQMVSPPYRFTALLKQYVQALETQKEMNQRVERVKSRLRFPEDQTMIESYRAKRLDSAMQRDRCLSAVLMLTNSRELSSRFGKRFDRFEESLEWKLEQIARETDWSIRQMWNLVKRESPDAFVQDSTFWALQSEDGSSHFTTSYEKLMFTKHMIAIQYDGAVAVPDAAEFQEEIYQAWASVLIDIQTIEQDIHTADSLISASEGTLSMDEKDLIEDMLTRAKRKCDGYRQDYLAANRILTELRKEGNLMHYNLTLIDLLFQMQGRNPLKTSKVNDRDPNMDINLAAYRRVKALEAAYIACRDVYREKLEPIIK